MYGGKPHAEECIFQRSRPSPALIVTALGKVGSPEKVINLYSNGLDLMRWIT